MKKQWNLEAEEKWSIEATHCGTGGERTTLKQSSELECDTKLYTSPNGYTEEEITIKIVLPVYKDVSISVLRISSLDIFLRRSIERDIK